MLRRGLVLDLSVAFGKRQSILSQLAPVNPLSALGTTGRIIAAMRSFADVISSRPGNDVRLSLLVRYVYSKQG